MQIQRLTPDFAVAPQISEADIDTLAALGFRSIIGNRPDGESADQPEFVALKTAATQRGLEAAHIPVVASQIGGADVEAFREALRILPKPIFAFCRTGTRSTMLWALANNETLTPDERIRIAAAHGYDIAAIRPRLAADDAEDLSNA